MDITEDEIFSGGIDNPTTYEGAILDYSISLRRMTMQVDKKGSWRGPETFYVVFHGVVYFEGPTKWNSAAFSIGPDDECRSLLGKTDRIEFGSSEEELIEDHRLFQVHTSKTTLKIVALRGAIVSKDIPPDYLNPSQPLSNAKA